MRRTVGYLTVYLSLVLALLVSLCLALIEGARSNAIRVESEIIMDIGLDSILAEYHRELLDQYNLFAIDSAYGTDTPGKEHTAGHLKEYIHQNMSNSKDWQNYLYKDFLAMEPHQVETTAVSILTDEQGAVFREKAVEAIESDVGLHLFQEVLGWLEVVEVNALTTTDISQIKEETDKKIAEYQGQEVETQDGKKQIIQFENPTAELERKRSREVMEWVVEDASALSDKRIVCEQLISHRMSAGKINQGSIPHTSNEIYEEILAYFLFQEYLQNYMGRFGKEKEQSALAYQLEYILIGEGSDIENIRGMTDMLTGVREAANAVYILKDQEMCQEAEAAAAIICGLFEVPQLTTLLQYSILLGWSFAESLHDVEVLLKGGRVPIMKSKETWYYSLVNALTGFVLTEDLEDSEGLAYEDYLRIFLMLGDIDTTTKRAMDMIEADIRLTEGNKKFRLDGCFCEVEARMFVDSAYGYSYEITRRKKY